MALVINDRVKETTATTGTGTVTLAGAVSGFDTFLAGIGNSSTTYYCIQLNAEFEVGLGTLSSDSSTLARTTVISSSNSDNAVNFSAGSKFVFCTMPASKATVLDASNNLTLPGKLSMPDVTSGKILVADGTSYEEVAVSGDVTIASSGAITIANNAVETAMINADAVTGAKIVDDAINSEHYTDGSIDTAHIAGSQITNAKMADNAIDTAEIAASAVETAKINDGAVTTDKLGADAITGAKIADDAINSEHYTDASIDTAHIADSQVTTAKIAADAITGAKIADDAINSEHYTNASIDTAHIANDQITAALMADNSIDSDMYVDGSIDTAHIANDQITAALMADNSIDSDMYVDGSIDTAHIANDQITNALMADDAIDSAQIADGSVDTAHIADLNVTTGKIAADAITGAKLADNAVNSEHYTDGSIDTIHLSADAVDGTKIGDNQVDSEHYAAGSIDAEHISPNVISGLTDTTIASADHLMFFDATDNALKKVDAGELIAAAAATRPNKTPIMYNGNMAIAQRATAATGLGGSDGVYPSLDRWRHSITAAGGSGRFTSQRVAVTDNAPFSTAMNFDCTTADTSIAAGEEVAVEMRFEGQDLQYFEKGYSSAKAFTVAFWCIAEDAKVYAVELFDDDNNRHVSKLFTTATSWTKHVIDFGADTSGKFDNNNALSMRMKIWLHAGSNFTGGTLAAQWQGFTAANRAAGIGSFYDNTNNSLSITGIQLEVGSFTADTIPDFQHETYGENLSRCERYCQSTFSQGTNIGAATAVGVLIGTTSGTCTGCFAHGVFLRTVMRAPPSIVVHNQSGADTGNARRGDTGGLQGLASGNPSTSSIHFENGGGTSDNIQLQWQFAATAEL